MKYISKVGAFGYPSGIELVFDCVNSFNPSIIWFIWPNGEMMWLDTDEYEIV